MATKRGRAGPVKPPVRPATPNPGAMPLAMSRAGARAIRSSNRVGTPFSGADADRLVNRRDEDLAAAAAPGQGGLLDRLDGTLDHRVFHDYLDLHLGQEVDHVFRPAIELGV